MVKAEEEEEQEEEGFVDPELPYQAAEDSREGDSFNVYPSRADEALKTRERSEQITPKPQIVYIWIKKYIINPDSSPAC